MSARGKLVQKRSRQPPSSPHQPSAPAAFDDEELQMDQQQQRQAVSSLTPSLTASSTSSLSLSPVATRQQNALAPHRRGASSDISRTLTPAQTASSSSTEGPFSPISGDQLRSQSHLSTVSSSVPDAADYWPAVDSDESDEVPPGTQIEKSDLLKKRPKSSTKKFFRYFSKKFGGKEIKHRYGDLPDDQQELERNEVQHTVIVSLLDEKLHLAPVKQPRRVLDVGAAPGFWTIDYATANPGSKVVGIDLKAVTPPFKVPRNCSFQVQDATIDCCWKEPFDFVSVRMLGDLASKEALLQNIYNNLAPGGWLEITEWICNVESPDHSLDGGPFERWNRNFFQGLKKLGSSVYFVLDYKPLLQGMGFVNIGETKNAAPTNPCYPGRKLQRIGNLMVRNWLAILDPLSVPIFGALGWSQEALDDLLDGVRKQITDIRYHSYMTLYTIVCQKPFDDTARSSLSSKGSKLSSGSSNNLGTGPLPNRGVPP